MYWIISISILCVAVFFIWASADIDSGIYLRTMCRSYTDKQHVALTFDDGPNDMTDKVLDVLRKRNVTATFFITGHNIDGRHKLIERLAADGHIIGNHTFSHAPGWAFWSKKRVIADIVDAQISIARIIGRRPLLFRPPFGVTNPIIGAAVRFVGLQSIGWSIRSLDTLKWLRIEIVCKRIKRRLHNGAVILLHDKCEYADILLDMVIDCIFESGYEIVPVDKLFDIMAYEE